jgi:hypothetical protein
VAVRGVDEQKTHFCLEESIMEEEIKTSARKNNEKRMDID